MWTTAHQRFPTDPINEEPGNKRRQKEPRLKEARHEGRHARTEADALPKKGVGVVLAMNDVNKRTMGVAEIRIHQGKSMAYR